MCARVGRITSQEEIEALLEPFGGVEAALEDLHQFDINWDYFEEHREALTEQYPDQWIAIRRKRLVAHGDTAEDVMRVVREIEGDQSSTVLRYLSTEERVWLL